MPEQATVRFERANQPAPTDHADAAVRVVGADAEHHCPVAAGDVYATGWRTTTFTIPASLRGKPVRLTFSANDVGDSIYDTAVLIDDVKLQ